MTKAVVLLVADAHADEIGRLIAATLSMNGYGHNTPGVIDCPGSSALPEAALASLREGLIEPDDYRNLTGHPAPEGGER